MNHAHREQPIRPAMIILILCTHLLPTAAGEGPAGEPDAAAKDTRDITLSLPPEMPVKTLIEFVSRQLKINIHYDPKIGSKQVTILTQKPIPADSLLGLLESVLKTAGLGLVDAEQPGWKKVVQLTDFKAVSGRIETDPAAAAKLPAVRIVSQVFALEHVDTATAEKAIKSYLSEAGGNIFSVPNREMLIVTDYAGNIRKIADLVGIIDVPEKESEIRMIPVEHKDARDLAASLTEILRSYETMEGSKPGAGKRYVITADPPSNQLVVISKGPVAPRILSLVEKLDVPAKTLTEKYFLRHVSPRRVERLLLGMGVAARGDGEYKSAIDEQSGLWIVTAPPRIHEQIATLVEQLDQKDTAEMTGNMRFYKLRNTTASEVLATIQALDSEGEIFQMIGQEEKDDISGLSGRKGIARVSEGGDKSITKAEPSAGTGPPAEAGGKDASDRKLVALTRDAVVTADPNTNTIIVVAPPAAQAVYKKLIDILDKRRPQVMIEVKLVTIDTSDGFSLGVQLADKENVNKGTEILNFSSFGLSESIDQDTGVFTLKPVVGFNGIVLSPTNFSAVIKALATSSRVEVLSTPKTLVNDNATANLTSVSEAPFTSINQGETTSTTSFGGYASAGTTVTVSPHISEGDYIQLTYSISLSSFSGEQEGNIPPPRQTNELDSEITIPNGHTVIVGGLTREDISDTDSRLPLLGDLPLIEHLFKLQSDDKKKSTLFVFIRPIILRDSDFEDLKYLSEQDRRAARIPDGFPRAEPMYVE